MLIRKIDVRFISSSDIDNEDNEEDMAARIHGTEHPWFWRIHITALVSLGEYGIRIVYITFMKNKWKI